ncbi:EAL domain-containing protein [Propionivibrio limicola]|uniref:EAL domain-containing protein n=1 Tax=Propionivibrio limicola TaxID=167645 RepID=UPI0012914F52|nr:EAL domain-containing protein [Propionivibrio limicola]
MTATKKAPPDQNTPPEADDDPGALPCPEAYRNLENISLHEHYQQRIADLLNHDQQTGLPNRTAFLQALNNTLQQRQTNNLEISVLHVSIDNFIALHNTVGSPRTNELVTLVATRIHEALRHSDRLARVGENRFAILLDTTTTEADNPAREVAERILNSIRRPVDEPERPVRLTASIGIGSQPAQSGDAEQFLTLAVLATEEAKARGGNQIVCLDASAAQQLNTRHALLAELEIAIKRGDLRAHYQPQVCLLTGQMCGTEALVRWQHPERGLIPPGEFIPLAENNHLIIDIGEWMLEEVCRQMREWRQAGLPPLKTSINLGARHFLMPHLTEKIGRTLERYEIPPHQLEIEITEGAMMQDVLAAIQCTSRLKQLGVRLALDDFGTGYSSLAYLSRFPIDTVKIDQSFVRDITTNPANAAIAEAIIAMSHKLGKTVLAEGVESEEQMRFLQREECDTVQGYWLGRPLPADSIPPLLQGGTALPPDGQHALHGRLAVLFVDDEPHILSSLRRTLRREGYAILTATTATEAMSLLARHRVHVVISDQRMPEMSGTEFLARVKSLYPETVRMILSGYADVSAVTDAINKGAAYRFLLKPWEDHVLKEELKLALRYWREQFGRGKSND